MKKTITGIIFTLLLFFTGINVIHAQNTNKKLVIHYFRYDNNYKDFDIWLWEHLPTSGEGIAHAFNQDDVDDKGAYISVDLNPDYLTSDVLGIIIRQNGWDGYREPGGDRFLDLSQMELKGNTYHAYFAEQDENIGVSDEDLSNNIPDFRPKILTSYFTNDKVLVATASHFIHNYKVLENDIEVSRGSNIDKTIRIEGLEIDLLKKYTIEMEFENDVISSKLVSIQNLYDTLEFESAFTYTGQLGVILDNNKTTFRLWAPLSEAVSLNIYNQGHSDYNNDGIKQSEVKPLITYEMKKIENGAWEVIINENLANKYYTFSVNNYGTTSEVTDPYSYSTGANGLRSMVVDFESTNPTSWIENYRPNTIINPTDYTVYELHVRDLTTHETWNGSEENRGKFLGFTERGTTYTKDDVTVSTGVDHIIELGVNAVQLLPIFDFGYIDEVKIATDPTYDNTFNWGYMPYHFNTLEGSYATNPFDGNSRINEFKQLVSTLHDNDIRVIMDVVYNHTGESESSNFNKIIPGYYHRMNDDGGFSNGSGTGNETASERLMMRKFMVDSLKFLATEYNLSGFRFDLMALHDVETMLEIETMLHEIDPTIIIYGEPWDAGGAKIDPEIAAGKENIKGMNTIGAFNDTTRDAVKGSVFNANEGAWLQGTKPENHVEGIKYGIAGGTDHEQANADKWHLSPGRTINYVSAHDNNTLYDKLRLTGVKDDVTIENSQIQANAIILTSQGVPFLHAGVEFLRSKPTDTGYDENSYQSPDTVNQLRWDRKVTYNSTFEYYKALINIRKIYPQFRMNKADDVVKYLKFIKTNDPSLIAYEINLPNKPAIIVAHGGKLRSNMGRIELTKGKEYKQLTNVFEADINGLSTIKNVLIVTNNTSIILVENKAPENVSIHKKTVKIELGAKFDPLQNINYDKETQVAYTSSFYDTNVSSYYLIHVNVVDNNGNLIRLEYTLDVQGRKFDVKLKGKI